MGCDIHVNIEYQGQNIDPNDNLPTIDNGRDYLLFGLLAGVRTTPAFSLKPKGLPDDISDVTRTNRNGWGVDGHSESYLTLRELKDLETDVINHAADIPEAKDWGPISIPKVQADWLAKNQPNQPITNLTTTPYGNIVDYPAKQFPNIAFTEVDYYDFSPLHDLITNIENYARACGYPITDRAKDDLRIVFWFDN